MPPNKAKLANERPSNIIRAIRCFFGTLDRFRPDAVLLIAPLLYTRREPKGYYGQGPIGRLRWGIGAGDGFRTRDPYGRSATERDWSGRRVSNPRSVRTIYHRAGLERETGFEP